MVTATEIGFARMRVSKVVGLNDGDRVGEFVVLNELDGERHLVDARCSDALNLAVLVGAPIIVALEMVEDSDQRQEGESAEAVLMRRALTAPPMTITKALAS
jgi:bifunctional DNase/RNase